MVGLRSRIRWRRWFGGLVPGVGWELLRQPRLWAEALRQARSLSADSYRDFRLLTAYGDPEKVPEVKDALTWLRWAKSFRRLCSRAL